MIRILQSVLAMIRNEKGQGMVEYALIIALIAVALILGLQNLEGGISGTFTKIVNAL